MVFKKGYIPWNKGLNKETDDRMNYSWNKGLTKETDSRILGSSIKHKNVVPWNKGLTKDNDFRILEYSTKLKGLKRSDEAKNKMSRIAKTRLSDKTKHSRYKCIVTSETRDKIRQFGFETLVIWERELKDRDAVSERIRNFDADDRMFKGIIEFSKVS